MKKTIFILLPITLFAALMTQFGCVAPEKITDKSGSQLWGENCSRCHNPPGPGEFNNAHWDVIGMHMRMRANLTQDETAKIMDFLKAANNQ